MADYKAKGVTIREDVKEVLDQRPKTEYMADRILPPLRTRATGGEFFYIGAGEGKKKFDTRRAPDGTYNSGDYKLQKDVFSTAEHGFEMRVDLTEELAMKEIFDERVAASEMSLEALLIDREDRCSKALFNTTTFTGAGYTAAAAKLWSDKSADIKADIKIMSAPIKTRMGIGQKKLSLIVNADIVDDMISTIADQTNISSNVALELQDENTRLRAIVRYLNIKEIIEVSSLYDTTGLNTDSDASFTDMWDPTMAMLAYVSPTTNSWKAGGVGRQPVWSKLTNTYLVESYDDPKRRSEFTRCLDQRGEKVFKEYGFLMTGVSA